MAVKFRKLQVYTGDPVLQEKTVTPTKEEQALTPDTDYDGLSKVTVNPIPTDYIIPSGTLEVTENGTKDVTNYKSVNVNVPTPEPTYWDGSYTLSGLGYTLTLLQGSATDFTAVATDGAQEYSIDGGNTWIEFTEIPLTLTGVSNIQFRVNPNYYGSNGYNFALGTTANTTDVGIAKGNTASQANIVSVDLVADTTLYIGRFSGNFSGGAD